MEALSLSQLEAGSNTIPSTRDQTTPATKPSIAASKRSTSVDVDGKPRRPRQKWTQSETDDLIKGCAIYGVGSWKKILEDPNLRFHNRTSVDLKDRFRTYFPEDYRRLYPNATSTRERATPYTLPTQAADFSKSRRKERNPFTKEEDENLLVGFGRYSGKWSMIQKDPTLGLSHRRSTDLRDRFRNAFPEKYVGAGFKPPPAKKRRLEEDEVETSAVVGTENVLSTGLVEKTATATATQTQAPTFQVVEEAVAATASVVVQERIREPVVAEVGFTITRLPTSTTSTGWGNSPHNVARAKEAEMVAKLRAALDMEGALGDAEIPLDPGLNDVAYQPHGQGGDPEAMTGLLDAASQRRNWKGD